MFTKTYVTKPDGSLYNTLLVAPLAILILCRRTGGALMNEEPRIAGTMGHESAFLIGDPNYYRRFGDLLAYLYDIRHESMPAEYIMVKEFETGVLDGVTGLIRM